MRLERLLPLTVVATMVAGGAQAGANDAFKPSVLSAQDLTKEIVGSTIRYPSSDDEVFEYYSPDGTIHGKSRAGGAYQGKWKIREDGTFCVIESNPASSGCAFIVKQPNKITYFRYDEVTEGPFDLLSGNPQHL